MNEQVEKLKSSLTKGILLIALLIALGCGLLAHRRGLIDAIGVAILAFVLSGFLVRSLITWPTEDEK